MRTLSELTKQEQTVLLLVAKGWRNAKIASELYISTRTVENHLYHIFDKLGVSSRTEAAVQVIQNGWLAKLEISGIPHDMDDGSGYARA